MYRSFKNSFMINTLNLGAIFENKKSSLILNIPRLNKTASSKQNFLSPSES